MPRCLQGGDGAVPLVHAAPGECSRGENGLREAEASESLSEVGGGPADA